MRQVLLKDEKPVRTIELAASAPAGACEIIPETVIEPHPGWKGLDLTELWRSRELLYFLTWRDIKIRYKQTLLGVAWAVVQPLMYMAVFTIVFGRMAQVPTDGIPYPLFCFAGLLPWTFFATGVTQAGNSVVASAPLIEKVYLPRLCIPFASVGAAFFDLCVTFVVMLAMMAYYIMFTSHEGAPVVLSWSLMLIAPLTVLAALATPGVGTILGGLSVAYRDFKHTIPFLIQLWMFATPAIYMGASHKPIDRPAASTDVADREAAGTTSSIEPSVSGTDQGAVNDRIQSILGSNPMNGLIHAFRAALLGQPVPWLPLGYSTVVIVTVFVGGCFYFHRLEDTFADII